MLCPTRVFRSLEASLNRNEVGEAADTGSVEGSSSIDAPTVAHFENLSTYQEEIVRALIMSTPNIDQLAVVFRCSQEKAADSNVAERLKPEAYSNEHECFFPFNFSSSRFAAWRRSLWTTV